MSAGLDGPVQTLENDGAFPLTLERWGMPFALIIIPEGASFKDMVELKGKPDIGDRIMSSRPG